MTNIYIKESGIDKSGNGKEFRVNSLPRKDEILHFEEKFFKVVSECYKKIEDGGIYFCVEIERTTKEIDLTQYKAGFLYINNKQYLRCAGVPLIGECIGETKVKSVLKVYEALRVMEDGFILASVETDILEAE
ncbi:MAG: hypothetical protein Ta2B_13230 [Termitinemataceae bacterium]|nr:MAG: hypothetical protein Ta2B_13230 [Termitinemataceae bacterium]